MPEAISGSGKSPQTGFALAWRFAVRELRSGLRGFYIFLGCIALGVAAITGVNAVAQSINDGIAKEGQAILGGDLDFSLLQREASPAQLEYLANTGSLSPVVSMRAMARLLDGSEQTLVELKAVDWSAYPLYGKLELTSQVNLDAQTALAEPLLLERLGLSVGDRVQIGEAQFTIVASILSEPDKLSDGLGFGPRFMITREGLSQTGLIQPGSLVRYEYRVRLLDPSQNNLERVVGEAKEKFPDAGWRIRSRANAAPALTRNVDRFSQFLTLVGLTALVVGGVGVANATRAFLETRRMAIATLKSVGASGDFIFQVYLIQIMIMTAAGVAMGLSLGIAMPYVARAALSDLLPVSSGLLIYPTSLLPGILYGFLTAFIFAVWPLARAREVKATTLFRSATLGANRASPKLKYTIMLALAVLALVATAVLLSDYRMIALIFVGAIAVAFLLLQLVAWGIEALARRAPRVNSPILRMAINNLHKPGSLTASVILSLGLGLALLVALTTIDANLRSQITDNLPEEAPDFFFVDIQNTQIDRFKETLLEQAPDGKVIAVPFLRGRVVELKGIPAADYETPAGGEWVLRGDRGITYAKNTPENSTLSEGEWWPDDYTGAPLVSVAAEEAGELGLELGDEIRFNVLGRDITATIASKRDVQWETLGVNFVFVFSPNTFAGAPHSWLATLTSNTGRQGFDADLLRELADSFPAVTSVRVKDAIDTVNGLIGQLATAIRAAASVALLSSILVLAGAIAAGNRERTQDAVIFKTLGATRGFLMRMLLSEYALLGLVTAIFAVLAGTIAAWFVISGVMDFAFSAAPGVALGTVAVALILTITLGLAATWRILSQKAAPVLREL